MGIFGVKVSGCKIVFFCFSCTSPCCTWIYQIYFSHVVGRNITLHAQLNIGFLCQAF